MSVLPTHLVPGKHKDTVETVHTALLLCMMMGLLIGAVCFFFSGRMLMLLHTKDDLIGQASLYLKIYAIGLPAMGIYNFGNGVLSAVAKQNVHFIIWRLPVF